MSLLEALIVLAILAALVLAAMPAAAAIRDGGRAAAAARAVATGFAAERWRAVARSRTGGLQFATVAGVWRWRGVDDGNGNGLRTAEIRSGVDSFREEFRELAQEVPGTAFGFPPGGPYPEAPPGTDTVRAGDDPIRFGVSDVVSFSPDGSASSGTVYITDGKAGLSAVVLFGATARARVWRWDVRTRRWIL